MKAHISSILPRALQHLTRRLATCAALLTLALACMPAAAQNVLFLHTPGDGGQSPWVVSEFSQPGVTITEQGNLDTANAISASTFTDGAGNPKYDIVIVMGVYDRIDSSNWGPINAAIQSRKANSFLFFVDTCGNCAAQNITDMLSSVNAASGFGVTNGSFVNGTANTILNSASPYRFSFTGLNPFAGGWFNYLNNVPTDNALYLSPSVANPPNTARVNGAYEIIVPISQSYSGDGACVFASVDSSMFDRSVPGYGIDTVNKGKIGPAFLNAVKPGGACGLPADVKKSFAPTTVVSGGTSTLTITVSNNFPTAVSGLKVIDTLPSPVLVGAAASTTCTGGTLAAPVGGNSVSLTGATLPAGGCTITVPVQWPAANAALCTGTGTTVTNTITPGSDFSTSLGQVNTPATATLSCLGAPSLTIAKSAPSPALLMGAASTYTLTVTNTGPGAAATATVLESLPAGLTLVSATGTNWTCSGTAPVSCTYSAAIAPSAAAAPLLIKAQVQPSAADATVTNYASVDLSAGTAPPTPGAACAPAAACAQRTDTVLTPHLTIAKSAPSPALKLGEASTYTLTVTNAGTGTAASATVLESLPAGLTLVSATGTNWSCNSATPVSCTYSAAIAPSAAAAPLLIKAQVQPSAADATVTNYASVDPSAGTAPPTPGAACTPAAACAQRTDTVLTPRLSIAKSAPSPDLRVGQASTYTITVTNIGTAGTAGATVQDALPPGLTLVSAAGSNWSCNSATPVVCTYSAALAPQAVAAPLLVKVHAEPGSLSHAVINYASVDPLGGNTPPIAGSACAPAYACAASPAGPVGAPFPVPTLHELALAALALLMGALGWRQRQALARR